MHRHGTLQTHQDYPGGGGPDNSGYSDGAALAVADLNGDGKLDVIATAAGIGAVVWLGNGDGTFQPKVTHGTGSDTLGLALEDFKGDGRLDMVVGNGAGVISWDNRYGYPIGVCRGTTVSVLMGNGDGTFGQPIAYPAGFYPSIAAVGDFRGDGKLDLAVNSEAADSTCAGAPNPISVLSSNGDGTFQAPKVISVNLPLFSLALGVGDFNLDGKLDLLTFSGDLSLLLGNGDGTFQAPTSYLAGSYVTSVWIGDVNGDGEADVVTTDSPNPGELVPASANSANVLLNLQGPDFSITAGAIKNLSPGQSASAPVKVESFADLTGSVALSCSVAPATSNAPACSLAPASVQLPANGSATSTLTISVPGAASALSPHLFGQDFLRASLAGLTITGLSFGIVLLSSRSRKSKLLMLLCTTALVAAMVCLPACGGSGSGSNGGGTTPTGTYTITVT